jgi:hypothetical protein
MKLPTIQRKFSGVFRPSYQDPSRNTHCSEFEVNNWEISDFIIDKLIPVVGTRPFPLDEQMLLVAAVCRFKPDYIFEWGTNVGKSARIFYEISKNFKIPIKIHSIDLPDEVEHIEHPHNKRGIFVKGLKEVSLHLGDGLDISSEIITQIPPTSTLMFFLDGDHNYESVFRELSWIMNNNPDSYIFIHDSFYQSSESQYNIGPFRAIQDAKKSYSLRSFRETKTCLGLPGLTLLYPERSFTNLEK